MSETTEGPRARFSHSLPVRFADTDCQGHVYFSNYLVYCDEALSAYLDSIGCGWRALQAQGLEFFFVDTGCQFKGRAYFEDRLEVHARVARIGNSSFTGEMAVYRVADDALIATGFITCVMVERETGKPTPVPQWFRDAVARYQAGN